MSDYKKSLIRFPKTRLARIVKINFKWLFRRRSSRNHFKDFDILTSQITQPVGCIVLSHNTLNPVHLSPRPHMRIIYMLYYSCLYYYFQVYPSSDYCENLSFCSNLLYWLWNKTTIQNIFDVEFYVSFKSTVIAT